MQPISPIHQAASKGLWSRDGRTAVAIRLAGAVDVMNRNVFDECPAAYSRRGLLNNQRVVNNQKIWQITILDRNPALKIF